MEDQYKIDSLESDNTGDGYLRAKTTVFVREKEVFFSTTVNTVDKTIEAIQAVIDDQVAAFYKAELLVAEKIDSMKSIIGELKEIKAIK